jgi:spore germination protein KB
LKNERLTQRQLLALLWAGLLAPAVEALPVDAGPGTWLSTLIALPVLAAVLVLWRGGELPKLLAALYGLWGVVLLAVRLRLCAQRLLGAGWRDGSMAFFLLGTAALALWIGMGHRAAFGRLGQCALTILLVTAAGVLALAVPKVELGRVFPLWTQDVAPALRAGGAAAGMLGWGVFAGFLYGHVDPETQKPGRALWWAAWGCGLLSAGQFIVLGCFGSRLSAQLTNPFFNLAKSVGVTGAFQRVESVVAALWMFSDLIQLGVLLYALREIGGRIFPGKEKQAAAAGLVLAAAGGLVLVPVEMEPVVLAGNLVFGAGIPVVFGLLKKSPKKLEKRC